MIEKHLLYENKVEVIFDSGRHRYSVNGENVMSVTGILGVLSKDMLVPWAAKEAVKALGYYDKTIWKPEGAEEIPAEELKAPHAAMVAALEALKTITPEDYWALLHLAKGAHARKKDEASSIGTEVHLLCEQFIKTGKRELPENEKMRKGFESFLSWVDTNKIEFVLSEAKV